MAQMDYFRRPQLAGNNITRLKAATIRGSIRRSDPDGFAAYPYFPGVVAAQTLNLSIDGTPFSVSLTGNGLSTILNDINTLVGAAGYAYAEDGVIAIQTTTGSAAGSIEVTGGTAAAFLGFDIKLGAIRSTGGDIPSTPEGRAGNWFGVSLPNKNDNLTSESLTRALARLSANSDVLFSEHVRRDALPKKVTFTTSDGKTLTPTSADNVIVYTGLSHLSSASTKEELAPFFFLVDTVTKLPPASRVVGIVRGSPAGLPPYADATSWTGGGSTGNVLGVDLVKASGTISDIKNGRVLNVSGADFVTAKVRAGDFVEITGATNLTPWSNNGYRWVVEEVLDLSHVAVRPMSSSELSQVGTSSTEAQPILELNMFKTGVEVYGSVNIKTGTYTNDVRVIVDPPIPSGSTYDLYLSSPGDIRSKKTFEQQTQSIANRSWASDYRPAPNVMLSSPTVSSWSAASVILTGGLARFSDRVVSIPARTIPAADFSNLGVNYVYWDKDANDIKVTRSHVKVVNSDPTQSPGSGFPADTQASQHIIAEVWKSGANISSVLFEGKVVGEEAAHRVVTVGVGGQFQKLEDAVRFINRWAKGNGFRSSTYPQFEIVIVSDTVVDFSTITSNGNDYGTNSIFFDASVHVRGASPNVKLTLKSYTAGTPFDIGWSGYGLYIFENLTITFADSSFASVGLFFARNNTHVFFKNITIPYYYDFGSVIFSTGDTVVFDTCSFSGVKSSFITSGVSSTNCSVEVFNSKIEMHPISVNASPCLFYNPASAGNVFYAKKLVVRDCEFTRLQTDQGYSGLALVGNFGSYTVFDGCTFSRTGANPAAQDSLLFKQQFINGPLFITNCQALAPTRCFIDSGSQENYCSVDNCHINVEPDAGNIGIRTGSVTNCTIGGSGGTTPTLIGVTRKCSGNFISGTASIAVRNVLTYQSTSNFFADISNNRIEVSGGVSILVKTEDGWNNNGVTVHGNQILLTGAGAIGIKTWESFDVLSHGEISGNIIRIRTGDGVNNKIGIHARGSCLVIGNQIFNAFSETVLTTGHIGIKLDSSTTTRVIGNSVILTAGSYTGLSVEGTQHQAIICNNYLESSGTAMLFTGATTTEAVVTGNRVIGTGTGVSNLSADVFSDNIVSGTVTSPTPGVSKKIQGNTFTGVTTINGQSQRATEVSNNSFSSTLTLGGSYVDFSENVVSGSLSSFAVVNAYRNIFTGSSAITFQFSTFVLEQNVFTGTSPTITIDGSASIVGNRFQGNNLMVLNVGDSTLSGNGYVITFNDNYCTCTTNLYSDYSTFMVVDGNYLGGINTITEVDKFNNNWLSISGAGVALTGRRALDSSGRATAVGNVLYGGGVSTFSQMDFVGCDIRASAGTISFTNCAFSGCDFEMSGTTPSFTTCQVSGSNLQGNTYALNTSIIATSNLNCNFTVAGGIPAAGSFVGCLALNGMYITVNGASTGAFVEACNVAGGFLSISKTNNNQLAVVKDCTVTGSTNNLSITGGTFADVIDVSGCRVDGIANLQCGGGTSLCTVYNSTFLSTSTSTITAGNQIEVKSNKFGGHLTIINYPQIVSIHDNFLANGLELSYDASSNPGLRYVIEGNTINTDRLTDGISFPSVNSGNDAWQHVIISNNNINISEGTGGGGNVIRASGIYFADGVSNVTIVGNSISFGNNSGDPGVSEDGAWLHAAIHTGNRNTTPSGTSACKNWVITGNRISFGSSLAGWSIRAGALTVAYKYIRIAGDGQSSGGSGNIMSESYGTAPNTTPENGTSFFRSAAGAYTYP